jgi:hypothetical protein
MPQIAGGCLCGKVRYSASGDPVFVGVCHCTDCQKFTGSAFAIVVAVPKTALTVEGTLTAFRKTGDTGKGTERSFCPACGSSVTDSAEVMPDIVMLEAGTLDDPSWVTPAMQIFCDSAQPWVQLGGEMKTFPKMPG